MLLNRPARLFGKLAAVDYATRVNGSRYSRFTLPELEGRSAQLLEETSSRSLTGKAKGWFLRDRCGKGHRQGTATYLRVRIVPNGSCHFISGDRPRTRESLLYFTLGTLRCLVV